MTNSSPAPAVAHRRPGLWAALAAVTGALVVTGFDAVLLAAALGGLPALLAHPRALALLGVWGAGAITLALARPVRTHDPAQTRAEPVWMLPTLFLVPLATAPVSALGERFALLPWFALPAFEWSGIVLAALGYALRIAAMTRLGSRFSPLVSVQRTHALETGGVYALVRHPGYVGSWLACAGAMLAFGSALALPLLLLFLAALTNRLRREERLLEERFGDEFRRYRARTGALWPRFASGRGEERLGGSTGVL